MVYRIIALSLMAVFYIIYIGKMLLQRKRGIRTDQMGRKADSIAEKSGNINTGSDAEIGDAGSDAEIGDAGSDAEIGDAGSDAESGDAGSDRESAEGLLKLSKGKKVCAQEIIMKIATYSVAAVEVISIVTGNASLGYTGRGILMKVFGTYFCIIADVIFFMAVYTMRDSWRAGINVAGDTKMISGGIYAFSRNPAFLGFDLLYVGILLMYFNPVLLVFTLWAIVMLHLQILQEEKFLPGLFGEEYISYKNHTGRYFGRGKWDFNAVKCLVYTIVLIFSIFYYITCLCYVGPGLSFVWIWLLLALFCGIRIFMLHDKLISRETGRKRKIKIPVWFNIVYHIFFCAAVIFFLYVEINVLVYMNMEPQQDLDYVIVLGAGLEGEEPSLPLGFRIQKAYNYMQANPDTVLIASGGKGANEVVSEASVIKKELVEMGIDESRIILEDKSTDTIENIRNSYAIIYEYESGRGENDSDVSGYVSDGNTADSNSDGNISDGDTVGDKVTVGIVTNGFHIYRARLIAKSQGHGDIAGIPARTLMPVGIHYIVREFFGYVQLKMGWG